MSSALAKFRKSNKDGDIKKAAQKVADPKKDTLTRLKHLRTVLGWSKILPWPWNIFYHNRAKSIGRNVADMSVFQI